jgi:hypothetical protein
MLECLPGGFSGIGPMSFVDAKSNDELKRAFVPPSGDYRVIRTEESARRFILAHPGQGLVYVLHRPDGVPFYVGKAGPSSPGRPFDHVAEARKGRTTTPAKLELIRLILDLKDEVRYSIDSFHVGPNQEYSREIMLTHVIGLIRDGGTLTNTRDEYSHVGPGGLRGGFECPAYRFE